jgi:hypothetical protein
VFSLIRRRGKYGNALLQKAGSLSSGRAMGTRSQNCAAKVI